MSKKTVYKVVGRVENKLVSIWVGYCYHTPFSLTYAPGLATKAPRGTGIFTFDTTENAIEWANTWFSHSNYEIWKCSGNVCTNQESKSVNSTDITGGYYITTYKELVQHIKHCHSDPVTGTVFCSSITLLERVV